MKKVGILSMHRIANYGSFLQAYALKRILEELECNVQFVDYHPGETLIPADGGSGVKRKILKAVEALHYDAPLKEKIRFIKYKKNFAANYYPYLGLGKMNYSPELDLLVIGSDEVFNCVQNNTNVGFSPELFGVGNNAKNVITYAASFGNTTIDKLKQYGVDSKVTSWLKDIASVSVRDNNSGNIVKELTGREPIYHFDPVLAYDFIGKCHDIPESVAEDKYMILYGYAGRFSKSECKAIRTFADSKGLKVFCIGGVQDCCDKFIDCDPFKVIAYFQHADYVVTDTFHGTILSVITQQKFVTFIRKSGYGNHEKISDLLTKLHLYNRVVDDIDNLSYSIEQSIDYDKTNEIIKNERQKTFDYLKQQLGEN